MLGLSIQHDGIISIPGIISKNQNQDIIEAPSSTLWGLD